MQPPSSRSKTAVAIGLSLILAPSLLSVASAHSWLECTDYRVTPNSDATKIWDKSLCFGQARCGKTQAQHTFGEDTGFNYHSGTGCQCARSKDNYDGIARAVYTPGQRVCLAYPSKNHVAAPCTNEYIPDAGVVITRSARGIETDDNSVAHKYTHANGDHVKGQVDYKGFQHCPNFCANKDKALCTMCFDLETDLAPGAYSFRWVWSFNSGDDSYSSCWEAEVRSGNGVAVNSVELPGRVHAATGGDGDLPVIRPASHVVTAPLGQENVVASSKGQEKVVTTPQGHESVPVGEELDCDDDEPNGEELDCDEDDTPPAGEHIESTSVKDRGGEEEEEEEDCDEQGPLPMAQQVNQLAAPPSPPMAVDSSVETSAPTAAPMDDTRCGVAPD